MAHFTHFVSLQIIISGYWGTRVAATYAHNSSLRLNANYLIAFDSGKIPGKYNFEQQHFLLEMTNL
jgi:hypothetical protein